MEFIKNPTRYCFKIIKTIAMLKYIFSFVFLFSTIFLSAQEYGVACYYGDKFQDAKTAYDEKYDADSFTAAHQTHKKNTVLKVTRVDNGKSVMVRVNDKGPFYNGRIIELSRIAAEAIGLTNEKNGTAQVKVEVQKTPASFNKSSQKRSSRSININDPRVSTYGLFEVSSKRSDYKGFAVQIGIFSKYKNVLKQVDILKKNKVAKVLVSIEKSAAGKDSYKILVGPYPKLSNASASKSQLRRKGFAKCFVVNLATVKKKAKSKAKPK